MSLTQSKEVNSLSKRYSTHIERRITRTVMVGDVAIGSDYPVRVQSMINEDTCLLYTSPSPRDLSTSRMPSSA